MDARFGGFFPVSVGSGDAVEQRGALGVVAGSLAAQVFREDYVLHPAEFVFMPQC